MESTVLTGRLVARQPQERLNYQPYISRDAGSDADKLQPLNIVQTDNRANAVSILLDMITNRICSMILPLSRNSLITHEASRLSNTWKILVMSGCIDGTHLRVYSPPGRPFQFLFSLIITTHLPTLRQPFTTLKQPLSLQLYSPTTTTCTLQGTLFASLLSTESSAHLQQLARCLSSAHHPPSLGSPNLVYRASIMASTTSSV